ncbi:MAG: SpoIIE family protein phosphatase [Phycisphaerales bacterium]|nr:SpoIIE family protein phosphatase [Phycisphaerales bacterium]
MSPISPGATGSSLRDFWTDGSVAMLCATISTLTGVTVQLRDERGIVLDPDQNAEYFGGRIEPLDTNAMVFPIRLGGQENGTTIGSVVIGCGDHKNSPIAQSTQSSCSLIEQMGKLIATMAIQMCTDVSELRVRIKEIEVLYRLNALLVAGGRVDETLQLALDSAMDALNLDAGAIMLLPEDSEGLTRTDQEDELERSASVGLSESWLDCPLPLSAGRIIDKASLDGEVIVIQDLHTDQRILARDQVIDEGLKSFLGAGMVFDGRPIGVIRVYSRSERSFTGAERRLIRSIGQSAAMAVEQARLIKMKARERRTQRSLKIAATVQKRMMPDQLPKVPNLDIAARLSPSFQIAGDFYDVFDVRDKIGIMVGDIVGKGIVAGLLMSAVRATLRAYAEISDDLSRVMARTNEAICRDTTIGEFATIWYGAFDPKTNELCYVTAGHEPPIVLTQHKDSTWSHQILKGEGMVAGVQRGEEYAMERIVLTKGQVVIAYTDGMMDAVDFSGNRWGRKRLIQAMIDSVQENPDKDLGGADWILERIFWHLRQFRGLQPQADDETVVVIRVEQ